MKHTLIRNNSDPETGRKTNALRLIKVSGLAAVLALTLAVFSAPTYAHQDGHGKPLLYYGLAHYFNHGYRYKKPHYGHNQRGKRYRSYGYRQRHYGNYRYDGYRGQRYSDSRRFRNRNDRGSNRRHFRRH